MHLAGICLRVADQFRNVAGRKIRTGDQHGRLIGEQCDRRKIGHRVIDGMPIHGLIDDHERAAKEEHVAIRLGLRDAARACHAAGTARILEDYRLA